MTNQDDVTSPPTTRHKIDRIYIACCSSDVHLARICVGSIRYWYPDVAIFLLKDLKKGAFSTRELEDRWDVQVYPTPKRAYGWGFIKLEAFFAPDRRRFLILDSDIVFLGRVLDEVEPFEEDFVVTGNILEDPRQAWVRRDYLDVDKIAERDPGYQFPGYCFNSGQIFATAGLIAARDFDDLIDFEGLPRLRDPSLFIGGDQGVLNLVFERKLRKREISVRYHEFMVWSQDERALQFDLDSIRRKEGYPRVIHWAGTKASRLSRLRRADLLRFYESYYHSRIPFGTPRKHVRRFLAWLGFHRAILRTKLARFVRRIIPK